MSERPVWQDALPEAPGAAAAGTALVFLLAALLWPQAAGALLRLMFVTLALVVAAVYAFRLVLTVPPSQARYSPFDAPAAARAAPTAPEVLRRLTGELGAADDPEAARHAPVPAATRWRILDEAERRLAERHGLALDDATHHARIRRLLSETTWHFLRPLHAAEGEATGLVTVSRLGEILDDVERL